MQICGEPSLEDCPGCGEVLHVKLGQKKYGDPNCEGVLPISRKTTETAEKAKQQLHMFPSRLEESKSKVGLRTI